jgi:hypothetical protein
LVFASTNGVAVAASGSTITISTPQDLRTTGSVIFVDATLSGNLSATKVLVTGTTASSSNVTGAVTVAGGVGIAGTVYAGEIYDTNRRVVSTSTGAGNLTISGPTITLPFTGPGTTTVGGSTSIPIITTDAFGRISELSTASISTTLNTSGTTGTGAVNLANQTLTFSSTNGFVAAVSGTNVSLSSPQDLRTTASPQFAGITSTGAAQINSTLGVTGATTITSSTNSTGSGNGALVVTGGVGVGGTQYIGGDLHVIGNVYTPNLIATSTSTLNTSSPMVYFQGSPYPYNFETGFYGHFVGGPANVYSHMGFVRNHNNNHWTLFSNVASEPTSTTINFADPGLIYDTLDLGDINVVNTTQSISTTTGAAVVAGGVGIGGNLNVNSAGYFGYLASSTNLNNPTLISTASSQSVDAGAFYVQTAVINSSATGSADMIAYPNNYDGLTGFADIGVTGNIFSDPLYTITSANDGYFFVSALADSGLGGNMVLATDSTGTFNDIVIATGSFYSNAEVARFHGNASTGGYFSLTQGTAATSVSSGALQVTGGAGITGSLYAGGIYTNSLNFANGSPFTSTTLANTADITANVPSGANAGLSLTATGVTAGNYGSATSIPTIVVDSKGRITSITTNAASSTITLSGTSGSGSVSGGGTLTFTGATGITTSISGSTVTFSLPQSVSSGASPTFDGTNFTGNATGLSIGGSAVTAVTATNLNGGTISATTGAFTGNVTRTSRPFVTNFSGNVAPSSPIQGDEWFRGNTGTMYKYVYDNVSSTYNWLNISSALYNAATTATSNTLALRDSGANLTAANFIGVASSAKYADLAEIYTSDSAYEAGTVVVFGGEEEITATNLSHDTRVAGVISTNPAYLMNSEAVGLPVAFTGRVPCKVVGIVNKGDILVTSGIPGVAQRMESALYKPGCIIGKALGENRTNNIATIEVVVGRF